MSERMMPRGLDPLPHSIPVPTKLDEIPVKPAVQSKEMRGAILAGIGAFLASLGIYVELGFLEDGWQMADLIALIGAITAVIGYWAKTYGKRAATSVVSGIFKTKKPT